MSQSNDYYDAHYCVPISNQEFKMLEAFKNAPKDDRGRASEFDLQKEYLKLMDVERDSLRHVDTKKIREILFEMSNIGIFSSCSKGHNDPCDLWELHAAERGCTFTAMEGDNE